MTSGEFPDITRLCQMAARHPVTCTRRRVIGAAYNNHAYNSYKRITRRGAKKRWNISAKAAQLTFAKSKKTRHKAGFLRLRGKRGVLFRDFRGDAVLGSDDTIP